MFQQPMNMPEERLSFIHRLKFYFGHYYIYVREIYPLKSNLLSALQIHPQKVNLVYVVVFNNVAKCFTWNVYLSLYIFFVRVRCCLKYRRRPWVPVPMRCNG